MKKHNSHEKIAQLFILFFWIIILTISPSTNFAQGTPSLFVVADFMKVNPEDHGKYLEVEQELWKPMHQERINQGIIVGWYLYAVEFAGSSDEYNYVIITLYDNAMTLANPWQPEIPQKVHPGMKLEELMNRTHDSRTHVKSELLFSVATAPEIPLERPAAYMQVNYMKVDPDQQSEYEQWEAEIWMPIHNESIRSGRTTGWGLWSSLFPRGTERPYQYITLNAFSEFSYIFELDFSKPFKNVHPEKDFSEAQKKTRQLRKIVRTELWDLIDYEIR